MRPHLEVLDPPQAAVLTRMAGPMAEAGFHLGGGTAIALHLGHRKSIDLDWFTPSPLGDPLRLAARLRDRGLGIDNPRTAPGTLHGLVDRVRVSLIEYRYPLLGELARIEGSGAPIAALGDLAAMKLAAVAQRGARRDFLDVHALVHSFRELPELLASYRRKYRTDDVTHVLYGLSYFDDADKEQMPRMLQEVDWEQVKDALRDWVRNA